MRLLRTKTLQFEEFFDSNIPKYAILSHRWEAKEISLRKFRKSKKKSGVGFLKISNFCSLAKRAGYEWVWIDTCCIDKKSSAELSEAINSMYRWYKNAEVCYAYLSDVVWEAGDILRSLASFRQSIWFARGWTLQELLAPSTVLFFDNNWKLIGDKVDLLNDISAVTGITAYNLQCPTHASVATKMSWASKRETSRTEDMAYCLMGIFDINMPLLYGEGRRAFLRLQLEIIKQSDDESIFAWTSLKEQSGLLATSPSSFAGSGDICRLSFSTRLPYSMTNKGLAFHVPFSSNGPKVQESDDGERIKLQLYCRKFADRNFNAITIWLRHNGLGWQRIKCERLDLSPVNSGGRVLERKHTGVIYVYQEGLHGKRKV